MTPPEEISSLTRSIENQIPSTSISQGGKIQHKVADSVSSSSSAIDLFHSQSWKTALKDEIQKPYFRELLEFVNLERQTQAVFPPPAEMFTALELTPIDRVKVVILGQDPYHDEGQAHGLSFSVKRGVKLPPSLRNIFTELAQELNIVPAKHGDLTHWARQGVLLLNAVLTVRAHQPNSHKDKGWERFTDAIIQAVSQQQPHVVFVLWGRYAQQKAKLIDDQKHTIIKSAHPSPLSASNGFFGSRPFSKINDALNQAQQTELDWSLPAS
ncbi:MAG: uracil-DNA glycosylase [Cyanosarcina radialis HA8281-LM2]|nr:uracil-DNA glycosylase [Cyanosarcina radialis HA8281-LM2]